MKLAKSRVAVLFCAGTLLGGFGAPTVSTAADGGGGGEKLLLGFEKAEMEKAFKSAPAGGDTTYFLSKASGKTVGYQEYTVRKGNATEGDSALALGSGSDKNGYSSRAYRTKGRPWKEHFQKNLPGMYEQYAKIGGPEFAKYMDFILEWTQDRGQFMADRTCSLIYTFGWFKKIFPEDWSGYDVLRVDIQSTDVEVADLRIGVADSHIEPFAYRTYAFPAGKWVTLEYNLKEAAKEKFLNPAKIADFHVWINKFNGKGAKTTLLMDNVRLAKAGGAKTQADVVKGVSWGPPAPPVIKVTKAMKGAPPDTSPIKPEPPIVIDTKALGAEVNKQGGGLVVSSHGMISAYDNNRMLLTYEGGIYALCTTDGGKTWKGLDGGAKPTYLRTGAGGNAAFGGCVSEMGSFTSIQCTHDMFNSYCQGDYTAPRHFSMRVTFDGEKWEKGPFCYVSDQARHCYSSAAAVTLPSGRLWCAIAMPAGMGIHAKYSDDGGLTWRSWRGEGRSGLIDGSEGSDRGSSSGEAWTLLAPYGDHVACFFRTTKGSLFSVYDGKAWSAPAAGGGKGSLSAVTLNGKDILLSTDAGVYRYSGQAWAQENGAKGGGLLSAAGKDKAVLVGFWEADKISVQVRGKDGSWGAAKTVAEEPGYKRNWRNFGVPQVSPPNFVPILWTLPGQGLIKVLRVPVE